MIGIIVFACVFLIINAFIVYELLKQNKKNQEQWFTILQDLLNRKMARDFYDYVNGTTALKQEKLNFPTQAKAEEDSIPPFINMPGRRMAVDSGVPNEPGFGS